jgi:hypothetical protein
MIAHIATFPSSYLRYNTFGILNIAAGIFNLSVGLVILSKNPRSSLHRSFFAITVTAFIWVVGFGMQSLVRRAEDAYFWMSFSYFFGVPFISPSVYLFSVTWREQNRYCGFFVCLHSHHVNDPPPGKNNPL